MYKVKLCGLVIACTVILVGISPNTSCAAETNTKSVTLSETKKSQDNDKAAFEEKMKKSNEKWKTLTEKQKNQVYDVMKNKIDAENKLMDQLVQLGVMEKEDAEIFKTHMMKRFNKVKESGAFPLYGKKGHKSSK